MSSIGRSAVCNRVRAGAAHRAAWLLVAIWGLNASSRAMAEVNMTEFGKTSNGTSVKAYTITNNDGVKVKLISRGATLVEWHVPDKNGHMDDVVFGFDDMAGYESKGN